MNVVIYARFSSHNQTEQSIEGQLKVCYEYAEKNGYTVVGEYIDRALSGRTDNRPEFLRMIDDSKKKLFQFVLVYQFDRFSRDRYDSANYKHILKKNGVRVLSARENISDDASGILVEGLLESIAEYYSAELSQKIKRGLAINASKLLATGGRIPLGYKLNECKQYVIDEKTAPIVVNIFEIYAAGVTIKEICDKLNSQGVKTSTGKDYNKNSLRTLLQNKKYIGIYSYDGKETPDGIPRIISDDLFNTVQVILDKNKKAPARARGDQEYILTTKLFCGKCHDMMTGVNGYSHTGQVYNYYKCNGAKKKTCDKKSVRKERIEDLVVNECRKLLTDRNIDIIAQEVVALCERERDKSNLARLEKLLRDNEKKRANLLNAVSECEIDNVRKALYEQIAALMSEYEDLKREYDIEKASRISLTTDEIKFFLSQLKQGNADNMRYRKSLINIFVNAIYLYDDKMTIIFSVGDEQTTVTDELLSEIESQNGFDYSENRSTNRVLDELRFFENGFAITIWF